MRRARSFLRVDILNMASNGKTAFFSQKVEYLQRYLRDRGVSTTGYRKTQLIELCVFVESLNLDRDPDCATEKTGGLAFSFSFKNDAI